MALVSTPDRPLTRENAFYGLDGFTDRVALKERVVPDTVFREMKEEIRALQAELRTLRDRVHVEKR